MAGKWTRPSTPRAKGIGHKGINMHVNDLLDAQKEQNEEKEVQQVNEEQQVDEKEEGE